ncbi:MAG: response regulator transcription factor [Chloroflexota bacterium]|nr:MAG: response regulator transcription factor [Chloroflexota bacterium]
MTEASESTRLRILIVDDHDVVRVGLRSLLDGRGNFQVVGEAGSVAEAVAEAARTKADVVIMDIRLPDGSGIEACREICSRNPDCKVLMLTSYADDEAIFASILAGAAGYILKRIKSQSLVEAINAVARGESLLDPVVTKKVLERMRVTGAGSARQAGSELTEQEEKVLTLVAEGQTNREISQILFLSEGTVKNYVSNILSKLHLSRRSQLAAYMARRRPEQ